MLHQLLNVLKKKMIVIATLFRELKSVKYLARPLSKKTRFRAKKHCFRAPFDIQHVKGSQTLVKSA